MRDKVPILTSNVANDPYVLKCLREAFSKGLNVAFFEKEGEIFRGKNDVAINL